jgi:AcrR family transcriptional regulator
MLSAAVTKKVKLRKRVPNRREQIVRAAARLFRENGYEATTVRDLADAVSMQSGSLFFHFGSKEEILLAVLKGGLERAEVALERQLVNAVTPQQKLAACFRAHLRTILEEERDAS